MAVPVVASVVNGAAKEGAGSYTLTAPTRSAGDVLTVHSYFFSNAAVTTPSGWTLVEPSPTLRGTSFQIDSYIRSADNTSADDFTVTVPNGSYFAADMLRLTGASATVDAHGEDNSGSSNEPSHLGLTTTGIERLLIAVCGPETTPTYTPPSGFTTQAAVNACFVATAEQAAAGASGNKIAKFSTSQPWATHLFAVGPKEEAKAQPTLSMVI